MRFFLAIAVVLLVAVAGCAGGPPGRSASADDACRIQGPNDGPPNRVRVPDPDFPTNVPGEMYDVERLYIANRFPTLLEVDCHGEVRPGIAIVEGGKGRRWTLRLRDDVPYTGGGVTARDVVEGWGDAIAHGAGVDSARALDDRRIEVFLERPALQTLASLDLVLWNARKTRYMPSDRLIDFGGGGSEDPRDSLARTALFLSTDPALADYATDRGMVVHPLPFDRTYVLAAPSRAHASGSNPPLSSDARRDLALSARAATTRASETPLWWRDELGGCGPLTSVPESMTGSAGTPDSIPVIYYDVADALARDLAERIVALAAMDTLVSEAARSLARSLPAIRDGDMRAVARGLDKPALHERMDRGAGFGFVTRVRNPVPDSCGAARVLLRRAPWLAAGGARLADALLPLVDASSYVILTSRDIAVTWDMYGTVRIVQEPELP
jgi:hypothetical protein